MRCSTPPQTCTGDKDQATFNLKLALKLSGAHPAATGRNMPGYTFALRFTALSAAVLPCPKRGPGPPPAGQGGVLAQEVDQLKRMLKAGANWEVISQMMSYISDKAAQVESLAFDIAAGTAEATPQSKPVFSMLGGKSSKVRRGAAA